MVVKTLDRREPVSRIRHTRTCKHRFCDETTREGKPYCSDHVEDHEYVRDILDVIEKQQAEHKAVMRRGCRAIKEDSLTLHEIIQLLQQRGKRTLERISRDMNLDGDLVKKYADYLIKKGRVTEGRTTRGSITLTFNQ